MSGPGLGGAGSRFEAVSSTTPADVWTVGSRANSPRWVWDTPRRDEALIGHWNGAKWTVYPAPGDLGGGGSSLYDVAALPGRVWAVGLAGANGDENASRTLTMRWDGESWQVMPSPSPGRYNVLNSVSALPSGEAWAVGYTRDISDKYQLLLLHWDGVGWNVDDVLDLKNKDNYLSDVVALAQHDVWAVGSYTDRTMDRTAEPLVLHWDGMEWVPQQLPEELGIAGLQSIGATAPNDIWIAGETTNRRPMIARWNGSTWSTTRMPSLDVFRIIESIAVRPGMNPWAVGGEVTGAAPPIALSWDGQQWLNVPTASPVDGQRYSGAAVMGDRELWAVGGSAASEDDQPHYASVARFVPGLCPSPTAESPDR